MDLRKVETGLSLFTLGALVAYVPLETYVSLPHGLWNPFYIVDLIAMVLMLWGAIHSLRARPDRSPALLCAAYAWASANGWRATFGRMYELLQGGKLDHGAVEMWAVAIGTLISILCLFLGLFLVVRMSVVDD